MEPFSLLKFWRTTGSDADSVSNNNTNVDVRSRPPDTDEDSDSDVDNDDDSFFDLVLTRTTPDCSREGEEDSISNLIELESPFKTKAFTVDSISKPQSPISLLKSAPKFRVFLLSFRRPRSDKPEDNNHKDSSKSTNPNPQHLHEQRSKRFTPNYCKEEEIPIGSLFSRDNSLRSKLQRERSVDFPIDEPTSKPLPKDHHVPMYLKLIKPLYNRASKRYTTTCDSDKSRLPNSNWDQFSTLSPLSSPATLPPTSPRKVSEDRRGNRGAGFRVVSKHLGKSRSASSTVGMTSSPGNRRDDSLLLQHDGIQSAILHCKRSYNPSSSISKDCTAMLRAAHEKSMKEAVDFNLSGDRNRCSSI